MKIIVLGSGVIGVASAWYLAAEGHEVTVLDRQPGPALETSFANAGEVSPGYASPWGAPGIPVKAIKWLFMKHSPLIIRPSFDPAFWRFAFGMLKNCNAAAYEVNKSRMVPIAELSRDLLRDLRAETGIAYDERMQGTLQVFRTEKLMAGAAKDVAVLNDLGVAEQAARRRRLHRRRAGPRPGAEEGIVPGGGVALINALPALDKVKLDGDEATGVRILRRALEEPLRRIAINAGKDGSVIVEEVKKLGKGQGYDAQKGEFGDMVAKGIIDPAKVTRSAIENAVSIAAMVLTTNCLVTEKPEAAAGMPAGAPPMY